MRLVRMPAGTRRFFGRLDTKLCLSRKQRAGSGRQRPQAQHRCEIKHDMQTMGKQRSRASVSECMQGGNSSAGQCQRLTEAGRHSSEAHPKERGSFCAPHPAVLAPAALEAVRGFPGKNEGPSRAAPSKAAHSAKLDEREIVGQCRAGALRPRRQRRCRQTAALARRAPALAPPTFQVLQPQVLRQPALAAAAQHGVGQVAPACSRSAAQRTQHGRRSEGGQGELLPQGIACM